LSFTPEWISGYPADKSDERMMLASDLALKFDPNTPKWPYLAE